MHFNSRDTRIKKLSNILNTTVSLLIFGFLFKEWNDLLFKALLFFFNALPFLVIRILTAKYGHTTPLIFLSANLFGLAAWLWMIIQYYYCVDGQCGLVFLFTPFYIPLVCILGAAIGSGITRANDR